MQIKVQKVIVEALELGAYHKQYAGQSVQVWVNPPSEKRREFSLLRDEIKKLEDDRKELRETIVPDAAENLGKRTGELLVKMDEWLSEMWSQGPQETHLSVAEIVKLREETFDIEPQLFGWLVMSSRRMMVEHLGAVKKA